MTGVLLCGVWKLCGWVWINMKQLTKKDQKPAKLRESIGEAKFVKPYPPYPLMVCMGSPHLHDHRTNPMRCSAPGVPVDDMRRLRMAAARLVDDHGVGGHRAYFVRVETLPGDHCSSQDLTARSAAARGADERSGWCGRY